MNVALIESAITRRTKAIMPVHLNGRVRHEAAHDHCKTARTDRHRRLRTGLGGFLMVPEVALSAMRVVSASILPSFSAPSAMLGRW
jgi:hypothetical protein